MRVLVNALSATNLSGRHVLLGHLGQLAEWTRRDHCYTVLYHAGNRDICREIGPNVEWIRCPASTAHWLGRAAWERSRLSSIARQVGADFVFSPAGTVTPRFHLPQISFAQNPWALVGGLKRTLPQQLKAAMQRRAYKTAVRKADMLIFNSEYMRQAYRNNAGIHERNSEVVYQALDESTHAAAEHARASVQRNGMQVLCVSAMAPHKGVETLVEAISILRSRFEVPANLVLAGSWPDRSYRNEIEALIQARKLADAVGIRGHVSREELHTLYAESRVFSLMSRCESFGIPAVEAQAFGTPVVSSNCCAIPEVCGAGGLFPEPGDAEGTAKSLARLLTDRDAWETASEAAVVNASKYHWNTCSRGLLKMFEVVK